MSKTAGERKRGYMEYKYIEYGAIYDSQEGAQKGPSAEAKRYSTSVP
jgi:hypothetical protein